MLSCGRCMLVWVCSVTRWYVQDAVSKPLQEGKGGTLLLLLPLLKSVSYESKINGMSPQTPLYFHSIHCLYKTPYLLFSVHIMDQSKWLLKDLSTFFIWKAGSQIMYKSTATFVGYTFLSTRMSMFEVCTL